MTESGYITDMKPIHLSDSEFINVEAQHSFADSEFINPEEKYSFADSEFIDFQPEFPLADAGKAIATGASVGGAAGTLVPGVGNVVGGVVGAGAGLVKSLIGGGKKESAADKSKQQIQKELKSMGHTQFNKMSGWKGDENAKSAAMQAIYQAVQSNPNAASTIVGWLEGGNITPGTIAKVKANFSGQNAPNAQVMNMSSPGKAVLNPMVIYAGGGLLLVSVIFLATRSKKNKN